MTVVTDCISAGATCQIVVGALVGCIARLPMYRGYFVDTSPSRSSCRNNDTSNTSSYWSSEARLPARAPLGNVARLGLILRVLVNCLSEARLQRNSCRAHSSISADPC